MGVFGPSSGLQQHLLKEHSSAIFHLNNDLIACELSCFFFFGQITAVSESYKP